MSHVLIVGCGYLGRRLASRLLARGHRVTGTTRSASGAAELAALGVEPALCDVTAPGVTLPQADALVHCVGYDRTAGKPMREVYVEGLRRVAGASGAIPRVVLVSSTSVYGQTEGEEVDEGSETSPIEENGRVVLDAELALRELRPDATILRFAGIYGPGRVLRESALRKGEPLGPHPQAWVNLIHVDDGAAAVEAALDHPSAGLLVNVADGHPVRRLDLYLYLARLLGTGPPVFSASAPGKQSNRRVAARRLREELGVTPAYPSYISGLRASLRP
jgi:nucleoside-diphosphate-sugar epimerase